MENISQHITYNEATKTNAGLLNNPDDIALLNMIALAKRVFEPLREWYKKPIIVNSFYRSKLVNLRVGGVSTSQHVKGEAIDITAHNKEDNRILFFHIKNNIEFDQLIWEKGNADYPDWIHVSLKREGKNRKQVIYT